MLAGQNMVIHDRNENSSRSRCVTEKGNESKDFWRTSFLFTSSSLYLPFLPFSLSSCPSHCVPALLCFTSFLHSFSFTSLTHSSISKVMLLPQFLARLLTLLAPCLARNPTSSHSVFPRQSASLSETYNPRPSSDQVQPRLLCLLVRARQRSRQI